MSWLSAGVGVWIYQGVNVMEKNNLLSTYKKRRDFKKTSEPAGKKATQSKHPIFVIQEHAARTLHYDFRLEIDGVLVSWAVPKGPSTNPREKRLAIHTENHPKEYALFEGVIPEGQYGAGTVMVWDQGTFTNIKEKDGKRIPLKQCLRNGQIEVWLDGTKLKGGYVLIKFKPEEDAWILKKMDDEYADARRNPVSSQPLSAKTGRSMKEIAAASKKKGK